MPVVDVSSEFFRHCIPLESQLHDYVQVAPALTHVSAEEWHRYIHMDKSDADVSSVEWWAAREDRMPNLAPIAALNLSES